MSDSYQGDGYEFSMRLSDGGRLLVHVTRAALQSLAGGGPVDQLSVLAAHMDLLRQRALFAHARTGAERVVLGPSDVAALSDLGMQRAPLLH